MLPQSSRCLIIMNLSLGKTLTQVCIVFGLIMMNRVVNFTTLFGSPKMSDYIDFVVTVADISVIIITLVAIQNRVKQFLSPLFVIFCIQYFLFSPLLTWASFWHMSIVIMRLALLGVSVHTIHQTLTRRQAWILTGLIIFTGLFDHYLLSNSIPVLILYVCLWIYIKSQSQKYLLLIFLMINSVVAAVQILFGRSIGLHEIGEPILDVFRSGGIAKQYFWDTLVLRGYGLMPHPNILGFIGIIALTVAAYYNDSSKSKIDRAILINAIAIVILSMSRVSYIVLVFILIYKYIPNIEYFANKTLRWIIPTIAIFSLVCISILTSMRINTSDVYRSVEVSRYFEVYSTLDGSQKLFGIGFGQYPFLLLSRGGLDYWQYQPVHNIFLQFVIEIGLVNICLYSYLIHILFKRRISKI